MEERKKLKRIYFPQSSLVENNSSNHSFVMIDSIVDILESIVLSIKCGHALLLEGVTGCGKTTIVEVIASKLNKKLVKMNLGDQMNAKSILGNYCCSEIPGRFIWRNGLILEAMLNGDWLLLEDIDQANTDVLSALISLLESNFLLVPGLGNSKVIAKKGFQLFTTSRLALTSQGWFGLTSNFHLNSSYKHFTNILIPAMNEQDLKQAITLLYPSLKNCVNKIVKTYLAVSKKEKINKKTSTDDKDSLNVLSFYTNDSKQLTQRDLFRWCDRMSSDVLLKEEKAFADAVDCFAAAYSVVANQKQVVSVIQEELGISNLQLQKYLATSKNVKVHVTGDKLVTGRYAIDRIPLTNLSHKWTDNSSNFAFTDQAAFLLEQLSGCVLKNEPVLLVGETGTGKTSVVQFLANNLRVKMHVINMNQHSDVSDLLGGYKPADCKIHNRMLVEQFEDVFKKTFSNNENAKFLSHIYELYNKKRWKDLYVLMKHPFNVVKKKFPEGGILYDEWLNVMDKADQLKSFAEQIENKPIFSFIEGVLVGALKKGDWVLLDEINLASSETLQALEPLLESPRGSVVLSDRGDLTPIPRHPQFRLFACMNPAVDVGKKDLPIGIRNRFMEFFVDELTDKRNLTILVNAYLSGSIASNVVAGIVDFYLDVQLRCRRDLTDGVGNRPHFSMRTLCRALRLTKRKAFGTVKRSLYESFCLSFLTQLDRKSQGIVLDLIKKHLIPQSRAQDLSALSSNAFGDMYVMCEGYAILKGDQQVKTDESYIITDSVKENLRQLARVVSARDLPVLLQGETSVGKTSLISYLAKLTGNKCYRVNNNEHTDIQEYIGMYTVNQKGSLVFKEGVLIDAMKKGYWVILDELNLAPSDVLEALNRLLDDNRELFIAETQEVVKAHDRFLLFATQNPPGLYGGRKVLSRAFRNRFVELHLDEIPSEELQYILHKRCLLAPTHAAKLVEVMLDLQKCRRSSSLFVGKKGFITLRELFRWAERYRKAVQASVGEADWYQELANHGYFLLAGRVRRQEEEEEIKHVIEKHLKRTINIDEIFNQLPGMSNNDFSKQSATLPTNQPELIVVSKKEKRKSKKLEDNKSKVEKKKEACISGFEHVVMTSSMKRMLVLTWQAVKYQEPLLLVGETGLGKTTACEVVSKLCGLEMASINCHMHTESSDFIGGLRPVRHHSQENSVKLFEWCDGVLVEAMKMGKVLLVDEISLAEDSVLERINSVLEPERKLLLVEKGSSEQADDESEDIVAKDGFQLVATMNPGGDYGKKELSPALRNRFTEVWCPADKSFHEFELIIEHNLRDDLKKTNSDYNFSHHMCQFVQWLIEGSNVGRVLVTIRDLLSWTSFMNSTADEKGPLYPRVCYIHGAFLVYVDSFQSIQSSLKENCLEFLLKQQNLSRESLCLDLKDNFSNLKHDFTIGPFFLPRGPEALKNDHFSFNAPTTATNSLRVMRALQLHRPILLEGSPGVGKTSLVQALAQQAGYSVVRINLSDQTDISDLFGCDLPVDGGRCGEFKWRDGPLLSGLAKGAWIVLDELNLASQSVLEGLNACFDHRAEIYVPELNQSFKVNHKQTRIFACQNPLSEGGGRKGLPKSFLNRFTQVYIDQLTRNDYSFILQSIYPSIPPPFIGQMVEFNERINFLLGSNAKTRLPSNQFDFNLRDLMRACQLVQNKYDFAEIIYFSRFRMQIQKDVSLQVYQQVFGDKPQEDIASRMSFTITKDAVTLGGLEMKRSRRSNVTTVVTCNNMEQLQLFTHNRHHLITLAQCVNMNWLSILVGASGSGKSALVEVLAHLTNRPLHVMSMNACMDTTEILGTFEQITFRKNIDDFCEIFGIQLEDLKNDLSDSNEFKNNKEISGLLKTIDRSFQKMISKKDVLIKEKEKLGKGVKAKKYATDLKQNLQELSSVIEKKLEVPIITNEPMEVDTEEKSFENTSSSTPKQSDSWFKVKTDDMINRCTKVEDGSEEEEGGRFEWVDSLLVKCLKLGHWILLDNINLCSSSVLDRLNALLEPNGTLKIHELGVAGSDVPEVRPHSSFRMFMCMDAKYGEISRAMRNRGVEIYIGALKGVSYETKNSDMDSQISKMNLDFDSYDDEEVSSLIYQMKLPHNVYLPLLKFWSHIGTFHDRDISKFVKACQLVKCLTCEEGQEAIQSVQTALTVLFIMGCHDFKIKNEIEKIISSCTTNTFTDNDVKTFVSPRVSLHQWLTDADSSLVQTALLLTKRITFFLDERHVIPSPRFLNQSAHASCIHQSLLLNLHLLNSSHLPLLSKELQTLNEDSLKENLRSDLKLCLKFLDSFTSHLKTPPSSHEFQLLIILIKESLKLSEAVEETTKTTPKFHLNTAPCHNLLQLSYSFNQGSVPIKYLTSEALRVIHPFLMSCMHELIAARHKPRHSIVQKDVIEIKECLIWLRRFLWVCLLAVKSDQFKEDFLMELSLVWKRINKHVLSSSHFEMKNFSKKMKKMIDVFNTSLGASHRLQELMSALTTSFEHSSYFKNELQTQYYLKALSLWRGNFKSDVLLHGTQTDWQWIRVLKFLLSLGNRTEFDIESPITNNGAIKINEFNNGKQKSLLEELKALRTLTEVALLKISNKDEITLKHMESLNDIENRMRNVASFNENIVVVTKRYVDENFAHLSVYHTEQLLISFLSLTHNCSQSIHATAKRMAKLISSNKSDLYDEIFNKILRNDDGEKALNTIGNKEIQEHSKFSCYLSKLLTPMLRYALHSNDAMKSVKNDEEDDGGLWLLSEFPLSVLTHRDRVLNRLDFSFDAFAKLFDDEYYQLNLVLVNFCSTLYEVCYKLDVFINKKEGISKEIKSNSKSIEEVFEFLENFIEGIKKNDRKDDEDLVGALFQWYIGWLEALERSSMHAKKAFELYNSLRAKATTKQERVGYNFKGGWKVLLEMGVGWLNLGVLQVMLFKLNGGMLDPVRDVVVENDALREQIANYVDELKLRMENFIVHYGYPEKYVLPTWCEEWALNENNFDKDFKIKHLKNRILFLKEKKSKLENEMAFRPQPSQYPSLCRNVEVFISNMFAGDNVIKTAYEVQKAFEKFEEQENKKEKSKLNNLRSYFKNASNGCMKFSQQLHQNYPLYTDVTNNISAAMNQCAFSLDIIHTSFNNLLQPYNEFSQALYSLTKFPLNSSYSHPLIFDKQSFKQLTQFDKRQFKCHLLLMRNHQLLGGVLCYQNVCAVMDTYVGMWNKDEEEKRKLDIEKDSFFKFKATASSSLSEEEQDALEIKKRFQQFIEDFIDIRPDSLQETCKIASNEQKLNNLSNAFVPLMSSKAYETAAMTHISLMMNYMKKEKYQFNDVNQSIWMDYWQSCYQTILDILESHSNNIGASMDCQLLRHHLLASILLRSSLYSDGGNEKELNVYKDSDMKNALRCMKVLETVQAKINECLKEWVDHPTLLQMLAVIKRITSFPAISPLMRFVNGLEALLKLAEDFQDKRSSMYILFNELQEVLILVKEFRGFELKNWKSSLEEVSHSIERGASRWWYHIYSLWIDYLNKFENENEFCKKQVLGTLQKFIEHSNVGEFKARMNIVLCFCGHFDLFLKKALQEDAQDLYAYVLEIKNMFNNIYEYYSQFVQQVEEHITNNKTPIEKAIKDFIKITKHSNDRDLNYYSVQTTAAKAHKTIHKFTKQFKLVLQQPVQPVFIQNQNHLNVNGKEEKNAKALSEKTQDSLDIENFVIKIQFSFDQLYLKKMKQFCNKIFKHSSLPSAISTVKDYSTSIIETVSELQALTANTLDDKEKRLKELKQIQVRKKYHLNVLFKELKKIGLSHKKGLKHLDVVSKHEEKQKKTPESLEVQDISSDMYAWFLSDPTIDVENSKEPHMVGLSVLWKRANEYILKCFTRRNLLLVLNPHQEINSAMHDRMKGFTEHLFVLLLDQKKLINNNLELLIDIQSHLAKLKKLSEEKVLSNLKILSKWKDCLLSLMNDARQKHHRLIFFIDSLLSPCASAKSAEDIKNHFSGNNQINHDNEENRHYFEVERRKKWTEALEILKTNWKSLIHISNMEVFKSELVVSYSELREPFEILFAVGTLYAGSLELLRPTMKNLNHPVDPTSFEDVPRLFDDFKKDELRFKGLMDSLTKHLELQNFDDEKLKNDGYEDISKTCQSLFNNSLKAVECLYKNNFINSDLDKNISNLEIDEEKLKSENVDEENINLLTNKLMLKLKVEIGLLKMNKIREHLISIFSKFYELSNADNCLSKSLKLKESIKDFKKVSSIVEQYQNLSSFFVLQHVAALKESSKMCSILMQLFTELCEKGFCSPAELQDSGEGGEGATEFEDIEGGGIGEGQGIKDVSDEIEFEEQVEGTKNEKKEDKDKGDKNENEEDKAIEMSGDLDGEYEKPKTEYNDENADNEDDGEEDVEKEMGDIDDDENQEKLDEKMWGGNDGDEKEEDGKDNKEESGRGTKEDRRMEMGTNDDNDGSDDLDDKNQTKNQHVPDFSEYNDEEDDKLAKQKEQQGTEVNEDDGDEMEIPDDLKLDEGIEGFEENMEEMDEDDRKNDKDEESETKKDDVQLDGDVNEVVEGGNEENELNENDPNNETPNDNSTENKDENKINENEGEIEKENCSEGEEADRKEGNEMDVKVESKKDKNDAKQEDYEQEENNNEDNHLEGHQENDEKVENTHNENLEQTDKNFFEKSRSTKMEFTQEGGEGSSGMAMKNEINTKEEDEEMNNKVSIGAGRRDQNNKKRPLETKEDRKIDEDENQHVKKRKKVLDNKIHNAEQFNKNNEDSDAYMHQKDDVEESCVVQDDTTLQQQQKAQHHLSDDQSDADDNDKVDDVNDEEDFEMSEAKVNDKLKPKKVEGDEDNADKKDNCVNEVGEDNDGKFVETFNVQRAPIPKINQPENVSMMENFNHEELMEKIMQSAPLELMQGGLEENQWSVEEDKISGLCQDLCEQLRLILEPTMASRLKGDYRTGKRISMRKVIQYIASQFRKDRIWLRRTKPSKRQYSIMISIDDSQSMDFSQSKEMAIDSLSVISGALNKLETGELAVCSFGKKVTLLHPFEKPFTSESRNEIINRLTFQQKSTSVLEMMNSVTKLMMHQCSRSLGNGTFHQLLLILSDGQILDNPEKVLPTIRTATTYGIFVVFVVIEHPENKYSILDRREFVFDNQSNSYVMRTHEFPFPYYVIIRDVTQLPRTLSDALRQWFELVTCD